MKGANVNIIPGWRALALAATPDNSIITFLLWSKYELTLMAQDITIVCDDVIEKVLCEASSVGITDL